MTEKLHKQVGKQDVRRWITSLIAILIVAITVVISPVGVFAQVLDPELEVNSQLVESPESTQQIQKYVNWNSGGG